MLYDTGNDPIILLFLYSIVTVVSHQTASRLLSSPNIQSGKYNEMDPILIGTAVSVVSYTTDSTALIPSRNVCREGTSAIKSVLETTKSRT